MQDPSTRLQELQRLLEEARKAEWMDEEARRQRVSRLERCIRLLKKAHPFLQKQTR